MILYYLTFKDNFIKDVLNVPQEWKCFRLNSFGRFQKGRGISKKELADEGVPCILYGDIYTKYNFKVFRVINKTTKAIANNSIKISNNTLLLTGSGETVEEIGKTILYLGDEPVYIGGDVIIFKPFKNNPQFISYALNSYDSQYQKSRTSNGDIVVHTYSSKIKDVIIALPDETLQQKIAEFLDHKTALIDKFINNRKKQIELLEEKKSAIINKAVTKGINPNVKLKPSGVDWIGEIPEHWEVWKLKFVSRITTGGRNTEDREEDGLYPFYVRADTVERINSYSFDGEAILTAGDGVGVARVFHYVNGKFDFHQRVYKISNFNRVLGKFLYFYMIDNFAKEVIKLSAKTTVDSLRLPMLSNFPIAHPDETEQRVILEYIERESSQIETLITKYQKQIDLIQEYKTALIAKAVTGKIDVREWQKPINSILNKMEN